MLAQLYQSLNFAKTRKRPRSCIPTHDFVKGHIVVNKFSCLAVAACLVLVGCSADRISHFPSHKLTVVQGNQVDEQAVAALRQGMSKEQVQHLLGTPLLRDAFHPNRWDYTYYTARNGVIANRHALTLYFDEQGKLNNIEGNVWDANQAEQTRLTN